MAEKKTSSSKNIIVYISTFPPRECGIATFTQDLVQAMNNQFNPAIQSRVIALNENRTSYYNYSDLVIGQIDSSAKKQYRLMAQKLNADRRIKLVNVQHEFGIFGGEWGENLLVFLSALKKPAVITFHTVLPDPPAKIKKIVRAMAEYAKAVIVMNQLSAKSLEDDYQISKVKIFLIPHGIHNTSLESCKEPKKKLLLQKKFLLSTFGLLGPSKGIEYVIRALPRVVKRYPNVIYLILGDTHPIVRKKEGERYFKFLMSEVERLHLSKNVYFYHHYLGLDEIITYLKATDIYISPGLDPKQSVSGTISYALGCGRPVISTDTEYAKYLVGKKHGILVKPRDPKAISKAVLTLIAENKTRLSVGHSAYADTRHMIWPNVAASYFNVFKNFAPFHQESVKFPNLKLDHLIRMTDNFGLIQHARFAKPNLKYGYSADDNSRALVFCSQYYSIRAQPVLLELIKVYLNFLKYAQRRDGSFANIVSRKKKPDSTKIDDVQGRAIWGLGAVAANPRLPDALREQALQMLEKARAHLPNIRATRAIAFAITGLSQYLQCSQDSDLAACLKRLANHLSCLYRNLSTPEWQWYEKYLTYSNSKLPEALFSAYTLTKDKAHLKIAERTLQFLHDVTFKDNIYYPIGQNGWFFKDQGRAYFDQQPEDTSTMIQTNIQAFRITGKRKYLKDAYLAFSWFLGKNPLGQMVYDDATGGCHDGVSENSLNLNEGAESTLSYLMARLEFEDPKIVNALSKIKF